MRRGVFVEKLWKLGGEIFLKGKTPPMIDGVSDNA